MKAYSILLQRLPKQRIELNQCAVYYFIKLKAYFMKVSLLTCIRQDFQVLIQELIGFGDFLSSLKVRLAD